MKTTTKKSKAEKRKSPGKPVARASLNNNPSTESVKIDRDTLNKVRKLAARESRTISAQIKVMLTQQMGENQL